MSTQVNMMLDSGAFSAWKQQVTISLADYMKYAHAHADCVDTVVNLDVIPGAWGTHPSAEAIEAAAAQSFANAVTMRKEGLEPLPVFHMRERMYWLEKMLGEGFGYIGLAPVNNRPVGEKVAWLDKVFGLLCGAKGFPAVKTHGFGLSSNTVVHRYPWFSTDSSTWMMLAGNGFVPVPYVDERFDVYDYTREPWDVHLSQREAKGKSTVSSGKQFNELGEETRAAALAYFAGEGFTLKELTESYRARMKLYCRFFQRCAKANRGLPFKSGPGLFKSNKYGAEKPPGEFRFIFTLTMRDFVDVLQEEGLRERLMSYYYLAGRDFDLREYVRTGWYPKRKAS